MTNVAVVVANNTPQQKFRITPKDLQVLEGAEAMLRCEVSNLAGKVQWAQNGFALGYNTVIPGFPRYSVVGDSAHGTYNLKISNASLEDDAEYQCQVGPATYQTPLRANAKLTVICKYPKHLFVVPLTEYILHTCIRHCLLVEWEHAHAIPGPSSLQFKINNMEWSLRDHDVIFSGYEFEFA